MAMCSPATRRTVWRLYELIGHQMTERALVDKVEPHAVVEQEVGAQMRILATAHAELAGHAQVGHHADVAGVKPHVLTPPYDGIDRRTS